MSNTGQAYPQLNDRPYKIEIFLFNFGKDNDGKQNGIPISYNIVTSLVIKDQLFSPFYSGQLTYLDEQQALEQGSNSENSNVNPKPSFDIGYNYRGDGHDLVRIIIKPVVDGEDDILPGFDTLFYVKNTSRSFDSQENKWYKTLELYDYWHLILSEKQSFFSTANVEITHRSQRSNYARSKTTGSAIFELLMKSGALTPSINTNQWDIGGSRVFYTSGINEKALNTLMNLYNLHNSYDDKVHDKCYLMHSIRDDMWTLTSLKTYYDSTIKKQNNTYKIGSAHVDRIYIEGNTTDTTTETSRYTPSDVPTHMSDSNATFCEFRDIESTDTKDMVSHVVYNYDVSKKQFSISMDDGWVENARRDFQQFYISNMIGKNGQPFLNFPITKRKLINGVFNNVFNLYDTANISVGRNQIINTANVLNNMVEIHTLGNTLRCSGNFVSVDSRSPGMPNDYNNKVYGDYLITSSIHSFTPTTYNTAIFCTKPYVFEQSKSDKGDVIDG